jgi:colicin import membrane protein
MFTNSKKIAELQDALAESNAKNEALTTRLAELESKVSAKAEDYDKEKDEEEAKKKAKEKEEEEANKKAEAEAELKAKAEAAVIAAKAKEQVTRAEVEALAANLEAVKTANAEMTETLKEVTEAFSATVEAAVTSTLAKMGIDPINVAKGNADGTKDKAPKSSNKGLSRAAELLNESLKNKNP